MQVKLQYAEGHLGELVDAADRGETVAIERDGKVTLHLVHEPIPLAQRRPRAEMINSAKGKIWLADDWDSDETNEEIARSVHDIQILPVALEHLRVLQSLPALHRDPFDRILIAQSKAEGMTLVTADEVIGRYDVASLVTEECELEKMWMEGEQEELAAE